MADARDMLDVSEQSPSPPRSRRLCEELSRNAHSEQFSAGGSSSHRLEAWLLPPDCTDSASGQDPPEAPSPVCVALAPASAPRIIGAPSSDHPRASLVEVEVTARPAQSPQMRKQRGSTPPIGRMGSSPGIAPPAMTVFAAASRQRALLAASLPMPVASQELSGRQSQVPELARLRRSASQPPPSPSTAAAAGIAAPGASPTGAGVRFCSPSPRTVRSYASGFAALGGSPSPGVQRRFSRGAMPPPSTAMQQLHFGGALRSVAGADVPALPALIGCSSGPGPKLFHFGAKSPLGPRSASPAGATAAARAAAPPPEAGDEPRVSRL